MSYTEHIVQFPNRLVMFKMYDVKGLIADGKMVETEYYKKEYEKNKQMAEEEAGEELTFDTFREWYDANFGEGEFDGYIIEMKLTGLYQEKELIYHPQLSKDGKAYYFKNEILKVDSHNLF